MSYYYNFMSTSNNLKVTVIGDAAAGKSTLILRLIHGKYLSTESTIGVSFFTHIHNNIKYAIWDTSGTERFAPLLPMYYKNSNIIIITFDVTCNSSLNRITYHLKKIKENTDNDYKIILVGTKIDLTSVGELNIIQLFIEKHIKNKHIKKLIFLSSLNGDNFYEFIDTLHDLGEEIENTKNNSFNEKLDIVNPNENNNTSCYYC